MCSNKLSQIKATWSRERIWPVGSALKWIESSQYTYYLYSIIIEDMIYVWTLYCQKVVLPRKEVWDGLLVCFQKCNIHLKQVVGFKGYLCYRIIFCNKVTLDV